MSKTRLCVLGDTIEELLHPGFPHSHHGGLCSSLAQSLDEAAYSVQPLRERVWKDMFARDDLVIL